MKTGKLQLNTITRNAVVVLNIDATVCSIPYSVFAKSMGEHLIKLDYKF